MARRTRSAARASRVDAKSRAGAASVSGSDTIAESLPPGALYRAFVQCVAIVVHAFGRLGLDPAVIRRGLREGATRARSRPYSPAEATHYRRLHAIGDIVMAWHGETVFLDDAGRPKALPITGPLSFATLSQRYLPSDDPVAVGAELVADGVLRALPNGEVKPLRHGALVPHLGLPHLDRLPVRLHTLLGTLLYNELDRGRGPLRLDREITEFELPARFVPEFDEIAKRQGDVLTTQMHQWLTLRSRKRQRSEPTARVSLWMHASAERNPAPPRTPRRPRKPA